MTQPEEQEYSLPPLNPRQKEVMDLIRQAESDSLSMIGYGGAIGGGKRIDISLCCPTPDGYKTVGDLKPGDVLFTETGKTTKVLAVHPIDLSPESYVLGFDDGTEIKACADHLWMTFDKADLAALHRRTPEYRERRRGKRASRVAGNKTTAFTTALIERNRANPPKILPPPTGLIRTTKDIYRTVQTSQGHSNHAIPVAKPLEMPEAKEGILVDPYLFGLWLGDGASDGGGYACHKDDHELIQAWRDGGYSIKYQGKHDWYIGGLSPKLRALGVLKNKHIPMQYLRGSIAQRQALLQGLMDTDGTVAKASGSAEICLTRKELIDGVQELIVSLGHKVTLREGRAKLYGRDMGPKYTLKWMPKMPVFRLKRKLEIQGYARGQCNNFRYIERCEPCDPVPMRCITVDNPTGLFLVSKSAIPTHNTHLLVRAAINLSTAYPGNRGVIGRLEFNKLETTTLEEFDAFCPPQLIYKKYDSSPVYRDIRLRHWPEGVASRIYFRGLENYKALGSEQYGFALLEEASELPLEAIHILVMRLRHRLPRKVRDVYDRLCRVCFKEGVLARSATNLCAKHGETIGVGIPYFILAASNPWPDTWFEEMFLSDDEDARKDFEERAIGVNIHFVKSTMDDNLANLPPNYKERNIALLPESLRKRFVDGEFGVVEGLIYPDFSAEGHRWPASKFGDLLQTRNYTRVIGGLDFGNENEMSGHFSAGIVAVLTPGGRLVRVDEFRDRGPDVGERQLKWMQEMEEKWAKPLGWRIMWAADGSQSWGIQMARKVFRIRAADRGKDSVDEGIKRVSERLQFDEAGMPGSFYLPHLKHWKEEMRKYRRDVETQKVIEKNDDLADCDRYAHWLLTKTWGDPNKMYKNIMPRVV